MPLYGIATIGQIVAGFFVLFEHVPRYAQPIMGCLLMVGEGIAVILWAIYFEWISHNYRYFMFVIIALSFISTSLVWTLPESTLYLYGVGDLQRCTKSLEYIAWFNGVTGYETPNLELAIE